MDLFISVKYDSEIIESLNNSIFKCVQGFPHYIEKCVGIYMKDGTWFYLENPSPKYIKSKQQFLLYIQLTNAGIDKYLALDML